MQQRVLMEHYLAKRGENMSNRKDINVPRIQEVFEAAIKHYKFEKLKEKRAQKELEEKRKARRFRHSSSGMLKLYK